LIETRSKYQRLQSLEARDMASEDDLDAAKASFYRAEAGISVAAGQVNQARAQVDADRTTLGKAEIRSPIDGIVLKRQVEVGQTVAASLQTPVLFTLAESLAQMQLNVAVDEADVGQVQQGQTARFTVDAFPDREFPAVIDQVRYAPQTVQGVVTYETVLSVDNSDLLLRPGMTATVEIVVGKYTDALLVPNAALRFEPPVTVATPQQGGSLLSRLFPRPSRGQRSAGRQSGDERLSGQRVWVLREQTPVPVPVKVGATDGRMTQVLAGDLQPGTALVVDASRTPQ
jgi:HlyD family secretion protein